MISSQNKIAAKDMDCLKAIQIGIAAKKSAKEGNFIKVEEI